MTNRSQKKITILNVEQSGKHLESETESVDFSVTRHEELKFIINSSLCCISQMSSRSRAKNRESEKIKQPKWTAVEEKE